MIRFDKKLLSTVLVALVSGCVATPAVIKQQANHSPLETDVAITVSVDQPVVQEQNATLEPSKQYIPKAGKNDVYTAMANPYLTLQGVIAKPSIELFIQARRALRKDQPEQARGFLKQLTEQDPSLSGPWVLMADIDRRAGQWVLAEQHYQAALAVNKGNVNAYIGLAKVQRQQGHFLAAQNSYVTALKLWRDFPEAHLNLAILYDQYLNLPLRAQRHMEAYLFLSVEADERVVAWLADLQQRTGQAVVLTGKALPAVIDTTVAGLE
ncbi:hypothetical protein EDC56_1626 [Sinobacterium caligoides]|uniref:Uncharacterized protein n=1 Tax=Sinobacterium caligoides TaxID=933926 RepID=A0A3N2DN15_9GAMM|nr:hypothetical protein [Sinobacterium caligoides]ROS01198.1 hypothetical protein EDC56_1626 [Sinobacterium caligoides]